MSKGFWNEDPYAKLRSLPAPLEIYSRPGHYGIMLIPYLPARIVAGRTQVYRLVVDATKNRNMTDEVFVYQRKPILFGDQPYKDDFVNVASPADIADYPINSPVPGDNTRPFFRLSRVDLLFRHPDMLVDAMLGIANDLYELVNSLEANASLVELGDVPIGQPEGSFSSSSSSSSS